MVATKKMLILDDDPVFSFLLGKMSKGTAYAPTTAETPSEAFRILDEETIDLAMVDIILPEMSGIQFIKTIKDRYPEMGILAMSAKGDMDTVIDALRAGASDFLTKPIGPQDLQNSIRRSHRVREQNIRKRERDLSGMGRDSIQLPYELVSPRLKKQHGLEIVGSSKPMKEVFNLASKVSRSETTSVLITGESGTGKELIARSIHAMSFGNAQLFHHVTCTAIPENFFDSGLFNQHIDFLARENHKTTDKTPLGQKGSLYLDKVSELPLNVQARLLSLLEYKGISNEGGVERIGQGLRFMASSIQPLSDLVYHKQFRAELYHRLSAFVIDIPPLRERKQDIPDLINYYVKAFSTRFKKSIMEVDNRVIELLTDYPFQGNVVELKNMIEQAVILCDLEVLEPRHINLSDRKSDILTAEKQKKQNYDLNQIERDTITRALLSCRFNKSKTARMLNISRQALDRKIQKYRIGSDTSLLS